MAEAKAATAKKRTRKPSPFKPTARITVSIHGSAAEAQNNGELIAADLAASYEGFATRVVHRTREGAGKDSIPSYMVYVAPQGYEFATATAGKGGVRLDKDTADLLRTVAASMGLDPTDSASIAKVAKALAAKVAAAE